MPEVTGIQHIALTVSDLDRSVAWYKKVFEFSTFVRAPHPNELGLFEVLVNGNFSVMVSLHVHPDNSGESFSETRNGLDHVSFAVADRAALEDWERRLTELAVPHSAPNDQPGYTVVVFRDPDNIQLEFICVT